MGDEDVIDQAMSRAGARAAATTDPSAVLARRRWFRALVIGGAVLGAAAIIGLAAPSSGYLVLDPLTRHVGVLLTASLALFLAAALVLPRAPGLQSVVRAMLALGLGLVLVVVAFLSAVLALSGETRSLSPDGRSLLVVREESDLVDPVWNVSVQQSSPVLAKTWAVACFNGDDPNNALASIRWVSSSLIEAEADSGKTFQIAIDPSDSQPSTTISVGCYD